MKDEPFGKGVEDYLGVLENLDISYFELDLKGSFTFVSNVTCNHLGFSREELLGMNFQTYCKPDNIERIQQVYREIFHTGEPKTTINLEVLHRDGHSITAQLSISLVIDASGQPAGFRGVAIDITEKIREGQLYLDTERKYRSILETMAEGLFETDLKGNYTFLNDAACRMLGYTREEMIGKNYRMIHTPDTIRYLRETYSRMYERHKVESLLSYEAIGKDGTVRVHQANTSIIRDKTGEIVGFRALVRDITENKRAEEALRESEERYRSILETMEEGYAEYDVKGNITFVNDATCRLLGYRRDDLVGMNYRRFHAPEVATYIKKVFIEMYQTGRPQFLLDYEAIRSDGSIRICEMSAAVLRDASGQTKGFRILVRDVTGRKKSEEEKAKIEQQLLQSQKMESVGRLAGGVAHDFNNMITVILGYAELIRMRIPGDNSLLKDLQEIEKAATRSRDITRQLLAFSRKAIIAPQNVQLNHLIIDVQKTILHLLGEDIDLKFYPGDDLRRIKVDPSQMEHVLINLAVNARDAMLNGGKLTIETRNVNLSEEYCRIHPGVLSGDYVMLGVSDDGVGMDKETLGRIFEPFFTTKETGKGTGLGLAMVYGIVKQNEGFINVYSEPGKGTTFTVYIPRSRDEATEKKKEVEPLTTTATGTILLVEDDDMVRALTAEMLEAIGYKAFTAASPAEALFFFEKGDGQIDLMITDVVMPGMSGRELAEKVMVMRPAMKVLFMSGYTTNVIVHRGVLDEGVNFIQKPFSMSDLARKLSDVLNG